jgi:hypothetical protein
LGSAGINERVAITVAGADRLIVGNFDELGHGKRLRYSLKVANSVKRSRGCFLVLPQTFVSCCGCGQIQELFSLRLAAVRINNDSLELRGILNKWTRVDHSKIDIEWAILLKELGH